MHTYMPDMIDLLYRKAKGPDGYGQVRRLTRLLRTRSPPSCLAWQVLLLILRSTISPGLRSYQPLRARERAFSHIFAAIDMATWTDSWKPVTLVSSVFMMRIPKADCKHDSWVWSQSHFCNHIVPYFGLCCFIFRIFPLPFSTFCLQYKQSQPVPTNTTNTAA